LLIFPVKKKDICEKEPWREECKEIVDLRPLAKKQKPRVEELEAGKVKVLDLRPVSAENLMREALAELEARKGEFERGWALRMQRLNELKETIDAELRGKEQLLLLREKKLEQDRKQVEEIVLKAQQAVELSNAEIQALNNFLVAAGVVVVAGVALLVLVALAIGILNILRVK